MVAGIGESFQKGTKYSRDQINRDLGRSKRPARYKDYNNAVKIPLPPPDASEKKGGSLVHCLKARASIREYTSETLSMDALSFLLWASSGAKGKTKESCSPIFRTAPSAGALYPIETYIVANRVERILSGIYHYSVTTHSLEQLRLGDFGQVVSAAALEQDMCQEAAIVFVWSAIFERSRWKYGQRAYRYIYLDAGHIAENLALAAAGIGLGSCQIGALYDDEMNAIINLDGTDESVIYMSTVGMPV